MLASGLLACLSMKTALLIALALALAAPASCGPRVRVVTYNLRQGMGPDGVTIGPWTFELPFTDKLITLGPWRPHVSRWPGTLDRLADKIKEEQPDIVMLQEVCDRSVVSLGSDQTARIAKRLGMHHAFGKAHDNVKRGRWMLRMGNAVLSRWPISDVDVTMLNEQEGPLNRRCVIVARVAHPDGAFDIASTHLASKSQDLRLRQVPVLVHALAGRRGPIILAGDFNATPTNPVTRTLSALLGERGHRLEDAFGLVGEGDGNSFPAREPNRRIDYILADFRFRPVSARVLTRIVESDHVPVFAEFERVTTAGAAPPAEGTAAPETGLGPSLLGLASR